jgi:hypothetical protein
MLSREALRRFSKHLPLRCPTPHGDGFVSADREFGFRHGYFHGLKFTRWAGRRNSCFPLRKRAGVFKHSSYARPKKKGVGKGLKDLTSTRQGRRSLIPQLNLHTSWFRLAEARLRLTRATVEVFAEELIHSRQGVVELY